MSRRFVFVSLVLCGLFLIFTNYVSAEESGKKDYPVNVLDRPLVLNAGMGELGLDLTLGLDKDAVAKRFSVDGTNLADGFVRGLTFGYGVMPGIEAGIALNLFNWVDGGDTKFGGGTIYGRYDINHMVGAELDIHFPGENFGDQRIALSLGLPFQTVVMPKTLKIHATPYFNLGFAKEEVAGESPQISIWFPLGATISATPELFIDLSIGVQYFIKPDMGDFALNMNLPLSLTVGYTVSPELDVYAGLWLRDLLSDSDKEMFGPFDIKSLGVGANYRF